MNGADSTWRGRTACAAIDHLCEQFGAEKAYRMALLEQVRARRARSRKGFTFWAAVATEIEQRAQTQSARAAKIRRE
jgi:hypothetical protein